MRPQTFVLLGLLMVLCLIMACGAWLYLDYTGALTLTSTATPAPNPPSPWATQTVWPTVDVDDLPFGQEGQDPLGAAKTAVPTQVPLMEIFQYRISDANSYWKGFRPSYQLGWLVTAGGEAVAVDSAAGFARVPKFLFWGDPTEVAGTRLEVAATVHTGLLVGTSRESVYRNLSFETSNDNQVDVTVNLPPECAISVGVPISNVINAPTPEAKPNIDLQRISVPEWWARSAVQAVFDETQLNMQALSAATTLSLTELLAADGAHLKHVSSVENSTPINPTHPNQHANIVTIAREATCFKLQEAGRHCESVQIDVIVKAAPAPNRLTWCGSGLPVMNVPYATVHVP